LGYPELAALQPQLIYCAISGFGQDGPQAARPGYDAMIQGMGGLMSVTGIADGEPGAGPVKVGVAAADLMAGMYAATAILGALYERMRSGRGQYIDLALLDTQLAWLANQSLNFLIGGTAPGRHGSAHPNIAPYQAFATADGHLMLAVGNDRQFVSFCRAAGLEALTTDARFTDNAAWLARLQQAQVPCGPINDIAQAFAEVQVRHRGVRMDLPHPTAGRVPQVRNPARFSRSALEYPRAPPLLGEHTEQVLSERLGLSAAEVRELRASGALGKVPP
jgi:crotonobetainyl-CoA:carnitine CoA-transferase CaiB-like acyl-CoA transferase